MPENVVTERQKMKITSISLVLYFFSFSLYGAEQIDLSKLGHGMMGVDIPGGPYYIVRRSAEEQAILINKYGKDNLRSKHANFMLIEARSPDSECALLHVTKGNQEWLHHPIYDTGGFVDLCTCAWFDLTGRRQSKECQGNDVQEAPHYFLKDEIVILGENEA